MEYITVKQYAQIKGISPQAVYKKLTTELSTFKLEVEGKIVISTKALTPTELKEVDNLFNQVANQVDNQETPPENQKEDIVKVLIKQNEELRKRNDELTATLLEQANKTFQLTEQLTELLRNSQVLLAKEKPLLIDGNQEETKKSRGIFGLFKKK